ncbi:MAG: hypothetical protein JRI25_17930 [Deltaproteobacteria bacterium]|nr:hypothetical protein [Deltaproteobacteria bacterium]
MHYDIVMRSCALVGRVGSPRAFAAAGEAIAGAIQASRGAGPLPQWAEDLADAMASALMLVQARTVEETDADFRVRLATSVAVLSLVRPGMESGCDGAVRVWTGLGMSEISFMTDPAALAARALLALFVDDVAQAEASVAQLGVQEYAGIGGPLHDWTVARRQRHGGGREVECFHNLRLAIGQFRHESRPALILLAGLVAWSRLDVPRARLLAWLDELALEVRSLAA